MTTITFGCLASTVGADDEEQNKIFSKARLSTQQHEARGSRAPVVCDDDEYTKFEWNIFCVVNTLYTVLRTDGDNNTENRRFCTLRTTTGIVKMLTSI